MRIGVSLRFELNKCVYHFCLNASVRLRRIPTWSGNSYEVQYGIVRNMEDRLSSPFVRIESYAIDKQLEHGECTLCAINCGHNSK